VAFRFTLNTLIYMYYLHCWENWVFHIVLKRRAVKVNKAINYHIYSSIWYNIKQEFSTVIANSNWILGNGKHIHFWEDAWCGTPLIGFLDLDHNAYSTYPKFVHEYIHNFRRNIPHFISIQHPEFRLLAEKVTIPMEDIEDKLAWKHNSFGDLQLSDSYLLKNQHNLAHHWARCVWSRDIPPSKSLLSWRLVHDKVPTDEKLQNRGCQMPSMCSLCAKNVETSFHLFFEFSFSFKIWCWFASILDTPLQCTSITDIWSICDKGWSPQCKIVIQATIVNIISSIWHTRNQSRFQNKIPHWQLAINNIISVVNLSGNNTNKLSNSSIRDFIILKKFIINIHPPKPSCIKEIIWSPPIGGGGGGGGGASGTLMVILFVALLKILGEVVLIMLSFQLY